jgi:membrane-associated phospholipid phosphatase
MPLLCVLIFAFSTPYSAAVRSLIISTAAFFTFLLPILAMLFQYKTGLVSDLYISDRKQRMPSYVISLLSYIVCVWCFKNMNVEPLFIFIFSCSLLSVIVLIIINLWWKISAHACGVGSLCGTVFTLSFFSQSNPVMLFCSVILLAGLVTASRLILKAHTISQVAAGFFNGLFFSMLPMFIFILLREKVIAP